MEYRKSWMYGSLKWKPCFGQKVDIFLEAVEKAHTIATKNIIGILCLYMDCKNHFTWDDVAVIRSHLIVRGFVKDYTVWIHHGDTRSNYRRELDAFIDGLDAEVFSAREQFSVGGGGWATEEEASGNNG